jgi:hypothetical protein
MSFNQRITSRGQRSSRHRTGKERPRQTPLDAFPKSERWKAVCAVYEHAAPRLFTARRALRFASLIVDEGMLQTADHLNRRGEIDRHLDLTNVRDARNLERWRSPLAKEIPGAMGARLFITKGSAVLHEVYVEIVVTPEYVVHVRWGARDGDDECEPPHKRGDGETAQYPCPSPTIPHNCKDARVAARELVADMLRRLDRLDPSGLLYSEQVRGDAVNARLRRIMDGRAARSAKP